MNKRPMEFDYFIKFRQSPADLLPALREAGSWRLYGDQAVRGWSAMTAEALTEFVGSRLCLDNDQFQVIPANSNLFRI